MHSGEGGCLYWSFASSEPKSDSCLKLGQIRCLYPDSVLTWIKQRWWVWLFISATCACQRQEAKILIYCGKHSRSQLMIHNPVLIWNNIEHRARHWFHFRGRGEVYLRVLKIRFTLFGKDNTYLWIKISVTWRTARIFLLDISKLNMAYSDPYFHRFLPTFIFSTFTHCHFRFSQSNWPLSFSTNFPISDPTDHFHFLLLSITFLRRILGIIVVSCSHLLVAQRLILFRNNYETWSQQIWRQCWWQW